ncbi:hypothetical protein BH09PSE3_BH09PSE3_03900 [soil metagenome]
MKTIANNSWSFISRQKLETVVEASSRIGGIVIFLLAIGGLAYFAIAH